MDILIGIIIVLTAIYIEIVVFKIASLKKKLSQSQVERSLIDNEFFSAKRKNPNVNFTSGDYYAYDSLKKVIRYEEKEHYSYYDFFGLSHEIGHLQDDKSNTIRYFTIMKAIKQLFFLPMYILLCILNIQYEFISLLYVEIVGIIVLFLAFVHLYFIHKYEKSASEYAICRLGQFDELSLCKKFAGLCIKQQLLMEILEIQFVVLLITIVA